MAIRNQKYFVAPFTLEYQLNYWFIRNAEGWTVAMFMQKENAEKELKRLNRKFKVKRKEAQRG